MKIYSLTVGGSDESTLFSSLDKAKKFADSIANDLGTGLELFIEELFVDDPYRVGKMWFSEVRIYKGNLKCKKWDSMR